MATDTFSSSFMMIMMALLLGIRHGFDLDHLATIDAITRSTKKESFNRFIGYLFSLGHGVVITLASFILSSEKLKFLIPSWFDEVGKGVSIFFLLFFGTINLWSICKKESIAKVPIGIKSFLSKMMIHSTPSPWQVLGIGALFAISFDTLSQVALFSLYTSFLTGQYFAIFLGLFFTLGMLIADGINGIMIAMLIQKADRLSLVASRGLGLCIALFSLLLGIFSLIKVFI